jgi:hypothetical protein
MIYKAKSYNLMQDVVGFFDVFICLGPQTKQIMVAKFQTLMLLIANAESSRKIQGRLLRKDGQMTGALIFKQNSSRMVKDF